MSNDKNIMRIGAISAYLDHLGVTGNLFEKAKKLISILNSIDNIYSKNTNGDKLIEQNATSSKNKKIVSNGAIFKHRIKRIFKDCCSPDHRVEC